MDYNTLWQFCAHLLIILVKWEAEREGGREGGRREGGRERGRRRRRRRRRMAYVKEYNSRKCMYACVCA